jgi:hypothetical protein
MAFDPYYTWLGIRPEESAGSGPNHYRLLGLSLFEDNAAVIDHAADRQMAHVRTFQTGPHAAASQRLLSEITLARITLLNPQKRSAYDSELRRKLKPSAPPPPPLAETQPIVVVVPQSLSEPDKLAHGPTESPPIETAAPAGRAKNPAIEVAKIIAGGLAGIVLSILLLRYVAGIDITGLMPVPKKGESRQIAQRPDRNERPAPPVQAGGEETDAATSTDSSSAAVERPEQQEPTGATVSDEPDASTADDGPSPKQGKRKGKKKGPTDKAVTAPSPVSPPSSPLPSVESVPLSSSTVPEIRPTVLLARRLNIPSAAEQEVVKATLEELYTLSKLKSEAEKLKVAGDLRRVAGEANEKSAEQFTALRQAAELAQEAGDAKVLADCIDQMAQRFEIDLLLVESTMFAQCARNVRTAEAIESLVVAARPVILFALSDGGFETAKRLTDATMAACARPNGLKYRKAVGDGQKEVNRLYGAWQSYEQALQKLQAQPDDTESNLTAGKWLCLERADWQAALPYLARSGNPALQKAAELELSKPIDTIGQLAAADAWYDAGAAGPKESLWLLRACLLYSQAKRNPLDGLAAARVERRLDELAKDDDLKPLIERFERAAARGRLRPELSPIVRRHCVLAFAFEPGDFLLAADKPMLCDLSGQENHGMVHGTSLVAGRAGSGFQFQAQEDYVESPDQPSLNPEGAFTVCAWIYQHSPVRPGGADDIVSKEEFGGGTGSGFSLRLHDRRPDINFGSGPEWLTVRAPDVAETGKWLHVAGVYDGRHEALFVDGVEVSSAPCTKLMSVSPRPVRVGRGPFAQDRRFHGVIDEVAMFDIGLTADDVRLLYELGKTGTPLSR